jgi:DNA-binding response OmpR family regulator
MIKTHIYENGVDASLPSAFVVDDEPQVRSFVSNVLKSSGFIPHQYASSSEVDAALPRLRPQLIVLDLSLGDSDAIEVLRTLAVARYRGEVLLISGHDSATLEEVQKIGKGRGVKMLEPLRKPFRIDQLRERIAPVTRDAPSRDDASLEAALQHQWLELWYQPKIDLRSH